MTNLDAIRIMALKAALDATTAPYGVTWTPTEVARLASECRLVVTHRSSASSGYNARSLSIGAKRLG